jgi:hypothetical protein
MASSSACILSCQEIHFHLVGLLANLYCTEKDKGLVSLTIPSLDQKLQDGSISFLSQRMMIKRQVHIQTTGMSVAGPTQEKLWHPTSYDHDPLLIFPQQACQFKHDTAGSFHGFGCVICSFRYHDCSMTFRIAWAAS